MRYTEKQSESFLLSSLSGEYLVKIVKDCRSKLFFFFELIRRGKLYLNSNWQTWNRGRRSAEQTLKTQIGSMHTLKSGICTTTPAAPGKRADVALVYVGNSCVMKIKSLKAADPSQISSFVRRQSAPGGMN